MFEIFEINPLFRRSVGDPHSLQYSPTGSCAVWQQGCRCLRSFQLFLCMWSMRSAIMSSTGKGMEHDAWFATISIWTAVCRRLLTWQGIICIRNSYLMINLLHEVSTNHVSFVQILPLASREPASGCFHIWFWLVPGKTPAKAQPPAVAFTYIQTRSWRQRGWRQSFGHGKWWQELCGNQCSRLLFHRCTDQLKLL